MPEKQNNITAQSGTQAGQKFFAVLAGIFFAIALLKFGNPVILDKFVAVPENTLQLLIDAWPVKWGYLMMLPLVIVGLVVAQWKMPTPKWVLLVPAVWLGWQFIAATQTVDPSLTGPTVKHYSACVAFFYLGCFGLRGFRNPWPLWLGLILAFFWIIYTGFDQHFGGLAETRRYFYAHANWREASPEFLKKMASDRIYSTLFYPNTLAGAILLLLPISVAFIWQASARLEAPSRWLLVLLPAGTALACLYWSGSKAGWLLMLLLMAAALLHSKISTLWKRRIIYLLLGLGLAGFGLKYAKFFERGSTSVAARFDYWSAALKTVETHPVFGTGPGTFANPYQKLKKPESEMARLVHNDYLEQASDSGIIGFLVFIAFVFTILYHLYRCSNKITQNIEFAVLLGLMAVWCHSFLEFHLFIPAIAWVTFFLMGWLWGLRLTPPTGVEEAKYKK